MLLKKGQEGESVCEVAMAAGADDVLTLVELTLRRLIKRKGETDEAMVRL
jgi:hypothetical protein